MTTMNSRTITVTIDRPPADVYSYVSNPANFPEFAPSFVRSARQESGEWILETTAGPMVVRFVEQNSFGVLDHTVQLPSGETVLNAMRVVANGSGSDVMMTVLQRPEMSAEEFANDADAVRRDLATLRSVLEKR